ncbi:MAG: response regulator, partial [Caldilineaceae bacterium]|nr:response regulator [Caldilineaceae bacterium]
AEDNTINQKVALRVLDRLGYSATVVDDGQKAVTAALEQPYDVILMDLHMPEMNGLDATRLIRAGTPGNARPYIIALTADAADGYEQRCFEAGMDAYVMKPIRIDDLAKALAHARDALRLARHPE